MGVKSLWTLLTPVGRPVMLETVEGKVMAIDSSIWIYQFQATMRDKEGRGLVNAHVLGFLRRICKLLFYGIKPVFVFDGGAPTLKRTTLKERKEKKSGAAATHAKLAEKLLAAQMRREALNQAGMVGESGFKDKTKHSGPPALTEQTVYLGDLDSSVPKSPKKREPPPASSSPQRARFYDHDPYRLPDVDLGEQVAKATRAAVPDPRLATEEELRAFVEEIHPGDVDVTSPEFRELPTEVQYEIVGDLRLKSRQTSYARLQNMLMNAPTPLDFSKQQIKNLQQRNTLTQQLLITTNSIGSAHISIPVRIASERNKEYILIKNEGASGGWILGIRNDGTRQKPIEIDQEDVQEEDDDEDMEEVVISAPAPMDPDLREYRQKTALSAMENQSKQQRDQHPKRVFSKEPMAKQALFASDDEDEDLAFAIQASLDQRTGAMAGDEFSPLSRLETSLSFANTGALRPRMPTHSSEASNSLAFGRQTLLSASRSNAIAGPSRLRESAAPSSPMRNHHGEKKPRSPVVDLPTRNDVDTLSSNEIQNPGKSASKPLPITRVKTSAEVPSQGHLDNNVALSGVRLHSTAFPTISRSPTPASLPTAEQLASPVDLHRKSDTKEGDAHDNVHPPSANTVSISSIHGFGYDTEGNMEKITSYGTALTSSANIVIRDVNQNTSEDSVNRKIIEENGKNEPLDLTEPLFTLPLDEEDEISWSRSPSPSHGLIESHPSMVADQSFDAANEMDPHAEEGEYARFLSQVKGKEIEDVRREIDEEIKFLNQQRKAAMRDSEDVTQQMINQIMIMLRLFGIPYITAPMEAEAQCAELVSLGLVDGVITDDSDVFLFGAQRVFKNMFNQSKTVECFLLSDLSRELGLDRDTLVRLAYLLGSDYVEGLPGVGPVVAMELLKEFPGNDGLQHFKEWWSKVQKGKDKEEDNKSKFRKRFKKKFKSLFLPEDWPNPVVKEAYYNPVVDSSDEPFKWGLPDLDALRSFLCDELGWGQAKVDDNLLPIIQKMNRRQAAAMNKQGNLAGYIEVSGGSGTLAPRKRQAYRSKRLQNVVNDFRKKRKRDPASLESSRSPTPNGDNSDEHSPVSKRNRAGKGSGKAAALKRRTVRRAGTKTGKKAKALQEDDGSSLSEVGGEPEIPPDPEVVARLRPRARPLPKLGVDGRNEGEESPTFQPT